MQTLRISMLGGRGVGKTSLLAGMYYHFNGLVGTSNLRLDAQYADETSAQLQKRLEELKEWGKNLDVNVGPPATGDDLYFRFKLGERERRHSLRLEFVDYPGGWIEDQPQKVTQILRPSSVVLVAINTPALMEATGDWKDLHDVENKPHLIKDIFVELYRQVHHPHLVLFVPLKCERYVQNTDEAQRLLQRVKEGYSEAFEVLQGESGLSKLVVVITPVQTIGSVVFSKLVSKDDAEKELVPLSDYRFVFKKVSPDAQYAPIDTDQPLRYVLSFVFKQHLEHKRKIGPFNVIARFLHLPGATDEDSTLSRVLDALDGQYTLRQAIKPFAEHCKDKPPFQIVQGRSLLLKPL